MAEQKTSHDNGKALAGKFAKFSKILKRKYISRKYIILFYSKLLIRLIIIM